MIFGRRNQNVEKIWKNWQQTNKGTNKKVNRQQHSELKSLINNNS